MFYIAIEGVIGVGKTSLAQRLGERLNAKLLLDPSDENPYLKDFYQDPRRFAFQVQLFFLISRYRQLLQVSSQSDLFHDYLIVDYIFAKDRIFAQLNLEHRDFALYEKVATLLEKEIQKPGLVIYLQSNPQKIMEKIRKRNRRYERNISIEYIRQLNEAYNTFFFHYKETPLLVVNTSEIDFVSYDEDLEDLIFQIQNPPMGVKYYVPKKG